MCGKWIIKSARGRNVIYGLPVRRIKRITRIFLISTICSIIGTLAYATKEDVMEWMINTQLGRRNLPPQQRIAVVKKFEKKIQDQAKAKLVESGKLYGENHPKDKSLSPNGETLSDKKIHTDKELAKMAGQSEPKLSYGSKSS